MKASVDQQTRPEPLLPTAHTLFGCVKPSRSVDDDPPLLHMFPAGSLCNSNKSIQVSARTPPANSAAYSLRAVDTRHIQWVQSTVALPRITCHLLQRAASHDTLISPTPVVCLDSELSAFHLNVKGWRGGPRMQPAFMLITLAGDGRCALPLSFPSCHSCSQQKPTHQPAPVVYLSLLLPTAPSCQCPGGKRRFCVSPGQKDSRQKAQRLSSAGCNTHKAAAVWAWLPQVRPTRLVKRGMGAERTPRCAQVDLFWPERLM
jgi:hypothetical protein